MSLAAIQDNLVKTSLVQQTQTRGDDVGRTHEAAQVSLQREHDRQEDQVVISSQRKDEHGIRPDDERRKEGEKRRRKKGDDASEEEREAERPPACELVPAPEGYAGARPEMRRINVVI